MAPFQLTKDHIVKSFCPLFETTDRSLRDTFFKDTLAPDVIWTITGAHELSGTTRSVESHLAASFNRLGPKLQGPIRFVVNRILLDSEPEADGTQWACVESKGESTTRTGEPYNNEYVWLTRWNQEGKIVEIRSYFDSVMAEHVLHLEIPGEDEK